MKFSVDREVLLAPLQKLQAVVERRQTLPILGNVLLRAEGDRLVLVATDLEVELSSEASLSSYEEPGEITLPARKLFDLCRAAPGGSKLLVEVVGDKAVIRAGRARFTLAALPAAEFPAIDTQQDGTRFVVEQGELKGLLNSVQFAMAQQDVRYYLNGVLFEVSGDALRVVATDGHRMAINELALGQPTESVRIIVPRKTVVEAIKLLGDSSDEVSIQSAADHVTLTIGKDLFKSKVIDGTFPDYERVLPVGADKRVGVDRLALREVLQRVAILSNEKYRAVRFELSPGQLRVVATNAEQEEADEELAVNYDGDSLEVGFNVNYVLDVLNAFPGDEVVLNLSDAGSSCLIEGESLPRARYVVMPMRL